MRPCDWFPFGFLDNSSHGKGIHQFRTEPHVCLCVLNTTRWFSLSVSLSTHPKTGTEPQDSPSATNLGRHIICCHKPCFFSFFSILLFLFLANDSAFLKTPPAQREASRSPRAGCLGAPGPSWAPSTTSTACSCPSRRSSTPRPRGSARRGFEGGFCGCGFDFLRVAFVRRC